MTNAILVVREFDNFSRILTENSFAVINCPLVETVAREDLDDLGDEITSGNYDGIFLTSRRATEIFRDELVDKTFDFGGRIYVLGKSGFEILSGTKLDVYFDAAANTAREMLEKIPVEDLREKRFLFIRGTKSLGTIPDFLKGKARLDEKIVYETRQIAVDVNLKSEIAAKLKAGAFAAACFFSPSGAESFLEQFGAQGLHRTKIATIGTTTADFLEKKSLKVDFTPTATSAEDFAVELTDYLLNEKRKMENGK
jgi:uroporphyrinogen-III synthase